MTNNNWTDIHLLFNEEYKEQWLSNGFTYNQTFDWVRIGLRVDEAYFATYLRDIRKKDSEWVLNYGHSQQLKAEFHNWRINKLQNLNTPNSNPHHPSLLTLKQLLTLSCLTILTIYLFKNYD